MAFNAEPMETISKYTLTQAVGDVMKLAQDLLSKVSGNPPGAIGDEPKLPIPGIVDGNIEALRKIQNLLREAIEKLPL